MSDVDKLRAQLRVAELEEALIAAKADGTLTRELKDELSYARWVARGGPQQYESGVRDRASEALYGRWTRES